MMIYATEQQVVVTSVAIVAVALVALFVGIIYGRRRGLEEAAEEQRWAQEQTRARIARTCDIIERPEQFLPEVAHDAWLAHEDQALTLANEDWRINDPTLGGKLHDIHGGPGEDCWCGYVGHDPLEPTAVINPGEESTTAWTRRMAADMDRFLRDLIGGTDAALKEITR